MPRKNSRVRLRNSRAEKFRDPDAPWMPSYSFASNLNTIVIPDGKCTLHRRQKDRYDTEEKALEAMARINHQRKNFPESRKVKRVYLCPAEDCAGWHLTSRTEFDEEQSSLIYKRKNRIDSEEAS